MVAVKVFQEMPGAAGSFEKSSLICPIFKKSGVISRGIESLRVLNTSRVDTPSSRLVRDGVVYDCPRVTTSFFSTNARLNYKTYG